MSDVKELEKQLELAKKKELKEKWEIYLDTIKSFIKKLEGKTVISHSSNGHFILYKIIGFEEKYYASREGFNGQWSPCRWIEIKTSSYISCRVADNRGRWYRGGIEHPDIVNFKAIVIKGKQKENFKDFEMSKIELNENTLGNDCLSTTCNISKIGYTEYKEYKDNPNSSRAMDKFLLFTQLAPTGMWEKAKEIADDNFSKTKSFWEEFEPKCKGLESLHKQFK